MKRKLLALGILGALLSGHEAYAQLPVSTSPENKNVVLEEFTGIHCVYCPDGHLLASNFANANPGDVVLINVHAGPFANPSANEPDFTTTYGDSIDLISDVVGYPAGDVNRRVFTGLSQNTGMAMSRGDWATAGNIVLGEASYVNVALEGDIDISTNVLTVDVEMYFTANAPSDVNLNVALLQDNISGPQTGASSNPGQVNPDGSYNHQHMLRELLTGQWGEVVTTTTSGTTVTRQYTYSIPASINGVPVSIGDLEVVAFVAEGQTDIITGAKGPMTYTAPAGAVVADLGASASTVSSTDYCDPNFTPEMTVVNNGNQAASNFDVSYSINGGSAVSQNVSTSLAGGASTTISFPAITLSSGVNVISYEVSTANNSNLYDLSAANNVSLSDPVIVVSPTPFGTFWHEGFESYALGDEDFSNAHTLNKDGYNFYVVNQTIDPSVTTNLGAYGNSSNSLMFDFYSTANGGNMALMWEKLDLSSTTNNSIIFDHAYAQYTNENDRLEIKLSTDCGATWNSVYNKAGSALRTRTATTNYYIPSSNDWATDTVDISSYDGSAELMVQFIGTSNYGNNLFVDNIQFFNSTYVGLEENKLLEAYQVYPNPAQDHLNIDLNLSADAQVKIKVLDIAGRELMILSDGPLHSGETKLNVSVEALPAGTYFIELNVDGTVFTEKLMVK
ncbi:Omp28-related outer membrane protein [Croceimicrobium sp.]|uniref:Omp28-related outer membrane protein n=1 Tax=Croceimicrobium sp. TaxID=2828340 RepID=UPI003BA9C175